MKWVAEFWTGSRGLESKTEPIVVRIGLGTVYINFA